MRSSFGEKNEGGGRFHARISRARHARIEYSRDISTPLPDLISAASSFAAMRSFTRACVSFALYLYVEPSRGLRTSGGSAIVRSRVPHGARQWTSTPTSRVHMSAGLKDGDIFWAKELRKGMHYRQLGKSDLVVSEVCLGTMTWGEQNSDEEAFDQLNLAYDEFGVNFIDAAEIYPVPTKKETQGRTEIALGKWLKTRTRENVIVASKVAGRSDRLTYLRDSGEGTRVRRKDIVEAVDKSLKRLGTDYIDLLQIHWPDRHVPLFGSNERYDIMKERDDDIPFEEQLAAFDEVVRAGKVRFIGTSNDTPYGVVKMAQIGERMGYPRVASVQNNYSLLVRSDTELGTMPEAVSRQNADVGFLAYSPLAGGVLTGKYESPGEPLPDARLNLFQGFMNRYRNTDSAKAVRKYAEIADMIGLTPTQLALAWVYSREFITSTIIGATNLVQLRDNLRALNCPVTQPAYEAIQNVYDEFRDPTKEKR